MTTQPTAPRCVEKRESMNTEREREIRNEIANARRDYGASRTFDEIVMPWVNALEEALNAMGKARSAEWHFEAAQLPAIDALRQWQHAQETGDIDELHNARAARDAVLSRVKMGAIKA